jgi:hypothetical protein
VPRTISLILRRLRSGRLEGRTIDVQRLSQPSVDKFTSSKAGIHLSANELPAKWIPAFERVKELRLGVWL